MNIIACYNIKGGVGKTVTAVNLAYIASRQGAKTLLWDLDPQGAASYYFQTEKTKNKRNAGSAMRQQSTISSHIESTPYKNLEIIPAGNSYQNLDQLLGQTKRSERKLSNVLQNIMRKYDFIFLDCLPNINMLSDNIFHSSDILLIPTPPSPMPLRTLAQIKKIKVDDPKRFPRLLPFFSMVDDSKPMHRSIMERATNQANGMLKTTVPYATDIERMGLERKPVALFSPSSPAARNYDIFWAELMSKIKNKEHKRKRVALA